MSVLLITHDLGVVRQIAQRVLVMYAGEIVESGPVDLIFQSPLHPYTRGLKNSVPKPRGGKEKGRRLVEIPGNVPSLNRLPPGCPFHTRCPEVLPRCHTEKPVLVERAPNRSASCWLHEER